MGDVFVTNDGVELWFEQTGINSDPVMLLTHGWSGSSRYFDQNVDAFVTQGYRVVRWDLRGHGKSGRSKHGCRVARLAKDLLELLDHLEIRSPVVAVGSSLGCAILWSFVENFGSDRFAAMVLVDQAPMQFLAADGSWNIGATGGVYDPTSLAYLSASLALDPEAVHRGTVRSCLVNEAASVDKELLFTEAMQADPLFLARLMADHAQSDWRETLRLVTCPALIIAGGRSTVFPTQGIAACADLIPNSKLVTFEKSGHWLYLEEPDKFHEAVSAFLAEHRSGKQDVNNRAIGMSSRPR